MTKLAEFLRSRNFSIRCFIGTWWEYEQDHSFAITPDLARHFSGRQVFFEESKFAEEKRLNAVLTLGEMVSANDKNDVDAISCLCSLLTDEEWRYALSFSRYFEAHAIIKNLEIIVEAMDGAMIEIDRSLAAMVNRLVFHSRRNEKVSGQVKNEALVGILNFLTLYSTQMDICRRLRELIGQKENPAWDRASRRILSKSRFEQSLVKDLRNYSMHFELPNPHAKITYTFPGRESNLLISTASMLQSGYKWKSNSKALLGASDELDVISVFRKAFNDAKRLIDFHARQTSKRMRHHKEIYDFYERIRSRHDHLKTAFFATSPLHEGSKYNLLNLVGQEIIDLVLQSGLTDDEAKSILSQLSNRFKNLPSDKIKALELEINQRIQVREPLPRGDVFWDGRKLDT